MKKIETIIFSSTFIFAFFIMIFQANAQVTFEEAFKDMSNGLIWSRGLPGTYSNGDSCAASNQFQCKVTGTPLIVMEDSPAARACANVGARLPTLEEFESLIRSFDHVSNNGDHPNASILTKKGMEQMEAVFGNDNNGFFWTATIFQIDIPFYGFRYIASGGLIERVPRLGIYSVRCVK